MCLFDRMKTCIITVCLIGALFANPVSKRQKNVSPGLTHQNSFKHVEISKREASERVRISRPGRRTGWSSWSPLSFPHRFPMTALLRSPPRRTQTWWVQILLFISHWGCRRFTQNHSDADRLLFTVWTVCGKDDNKHFKELDNCCFAALQPN